MHFILNTREDFFKKKKKSHLWLKCVRKQSNPALGPTYCWNIYLMRFRSVWPSSGIWEASRSSTVYTHRSCINYHVSDWEDFWTEDNLEITENRCFGSKKTDTNSFFLTDIYYFVYFFRCVVIHHRLQRVACIKLRLSEGHGAFQWDSESRLSEFQVGYIIRNTSLKERCAKFTDWTDWKNKCRSV